MSLFANGFGNGHVRVTQPNRCSCCYIHIHSFPHKLFFCCRLISWFLRKAHLYAMCAIKDDVHLLMNDDAMEKHFVCSPKTKIIHGWWMLVANAIGCYSFYASGRNEIANIWMCFVSQSRVEYILIAVRADQIDCQFDGRLEDTWMWWQW